MFYRMLAFTGLSLSWHMGKMGLALTGTVNETGRSQSQVLHERITDGEESYLEELRGEPPDHDDGVGIARLARAAHKMLQHKPAVAALPLQFNP